MSFRKILIPFIPLYTIATSIRNYLYDTGKWKSHGFEKPVIVVGNLTTGGTGKTPHVEMLLDLFNHEKLKAGVISRGYKRATHEQIEVKETNNYLEVGDEPLQIKLKYKDNIIVVNKNRIEGIQYIFDTYPTTKVVIMDDGFQHRKVKPKLSIVLIDSNTIDKKDFLLPAGNKRESMHSLNRADMVILTKTPSSLNPIEKRLLKEKISTNKTLPIFCTFFKYGALYNVKDDKPSFFEKEYYAERDYELILVTGIAQSESLHEELKKEFKIIHHLKFKDHHPYSKDDIKKITTAFDAIPNEKKIIITTEKDAIRMFIPDLQQELKDYPIFFISIEVKFHHDEYEQFKHLILQSVRSDKRSLSIYS